MIPETEADIIKASKALKDADLPVALFPFKCNETLNSIKISNENEDMFLGALCPPDINEIQGAIASGAHFIICENAEKSVITRCISNGIDLIVLVDSINAVNSADENNAEAVVIDTNKPGCSRLIDHILKNTELTLFLKGTSENLTFDKLRNIPSVAAFIIDYPDELFDDIFNRSHMMLHKMLGLKFEELSLTEKSLKKEEAHVFSALSAIPLTLNSEKELLTIGVKDMDRTIAYLKWKSIYMDPLSAKMDGSKILETELYSDFSGWPVKLINRSNEFPAD